MSITTAAGLVGEHLREQEFVEIYGHHDADGIAASSIMAFALRRAGIQFRLRILPRITPADLSPDESTLLCDFGSALTSLPEEVMVIDHHLPSFAGEYHVNPCLEEIDGERELSASGAAFLVAQHLGDNRDLAGLAMLGMIGDRQAFEGINREIAGDAMANSVITPHKSLRLPGRDLTEKLYLAVDPHLEGISGDEERVEALTGACGTEDPSLLLSHIILSVAPSTNARAMESLYGDTYELQREVVHDAHTLTSLIDACGKSGRGGLGAALCLRSPEVVEEAWEVTRRYRLQVIEGLKTAECSGNIPIYEVRDAAVSGSVADLLAYDGLHNQPVATFARSGEHYSVSARCPAGVSCDLASVLNKLAEKSGGSGGGHPGRAGAWINADAFEGFRKDLQEAIAS